MKIALLSDYTLNHVADKLPYEVYLCPFGTMHQEILDLDSNLYKFNPDVCVVFGDLEPKVGRTVKVKLPKFDELNFIPKDWFDLKWWYNGKLPFNPKYTNFVVKELIKLIEPPKKCIVLDLDETLWGGVRADEGEKLTEEFMDFQNYLLTLKDRGVLLAICSKGDNQELPDMPIKDKDIAIKKINWIDKPTNIQEIAKELNIGLDSIVFIDDNPAERFIVRDILPEVGVPEIKDSYDLLPSLSEYSFNSVITEEDKHRTEYYKRPVNLPQYLEELEMTATWGEMDEETKPRIVQLLEKTNQFNLTKFHRLTDKVYWFRLKDKFGDLGIVSVVILNDNHIDNWVMSCRVFARGLEQFIFNKIARTGMTGEYIPNKKNSLVADLYERLGFTKEGDIWKLRKVQSLPTKIKG